MTFPFPGFSPTASGAGDPYFSSVKLLLGFEGSNGATATTDQSGSPHAMTFVGNAQLSTSSPLIGSSSLLLDGTGDYLTTPDSPDWFFDTGAFTIEGFFSFAATPTSCILLTQWAGGWAFWFSGGALFFRDGNLHDSAGYTWSPTLNTRYWIAMSRSATGVLRIRVDGVMKTKTINYNWSIPNASSVLCIGSLAPAGFGAGSDLNGKCDEIRITKGVDRYDTDSDVTVPTAAFPRS